MIRMGLFKKQTDPISERARALNAQISALEAKIQKLNGQLEPGAEAPRVRSTAMPFRGAVPAQTQPTPAKEPEPIFEDINQNGIKAAGENLVTPQHFNELGVRKYDLVALIERIKRQFQGPPVANPKLVNYLAAGSIQGLRPLRYEKRVARNRFIALTVVLGLVLLGLVVALIKHH